MTNSPGPADVFWMAHDGLPRQAPGSVATTELLLGLAAPLPDRPRILDIGCGTGAASLPLAAATGGEVVAVDTHAPFLDRLRSEARAAGLAERIETLDAAMQDLPLPAGGTDLLWAEGSAYLMGFDAALAQWRRLLAPDGVLVLTEAVWTTPQPAAGARAFWDPAYPGMRSTAANAAAAEAAGWTVRATYLLPDSDWAAYYGPLADRIDALRARGVDPAVLDEVAREIDVRRAHGDDYGYAGYVLRPHGRAK
ncbi:class I SAM-dependent methyltransferase [Pseudonocardia humida]|uniref:class I SAM-dependent methyltransferase n=1 Tax=Pseudonocardia humida TaxID=2800819 RepID=UPI00207C41E0|nr:class I SAM-dependent methyltransferase [Pseudonocardia humida]